MATKTKYIISLGILILIIFFVGFFINYQHTPYQQENALQNQDKLNVIVSILPQKNFVKHVGGNYTNVKELIPPGGSPATYEPRPSDLINVEKADIYFRIGYIPFEKSHIAKFADLNPNMEIIDTSKNVKLRYFGGSENYTENSNETAQLNEIDPHIWLSTIEVKKQIDIIADTLSKKDPKNSAEYIQNAENFKKELDTLHKEIATKFRELKINKFLVFHPAWSYFANEYGLKQIEIEQYGKEPTVEHLQYIIDKAKEDNIKVIFVQSQFNKEIAKSIAEEVGATVVSIDPLSEDYINNLRNVAITISSYLSK